mgnify:CR=1 FL=1
MRLKIDKLFGKYNYDLSFDNKLNILIGENGCGKSTILKIIKNLANKDICSLSKIKFNYIIISNDDVSIKINRSDIIQHDIVNQFDFRRRLYDFINDYDFSNVQLNDDSFNDFYNKMIEELSNDKIEKNCVDFDNFKVFLKEDLKLFNYTYDDRVYYEYFTFIKSPYGSKYYFYYIFIISMFYKHNRKIPSLYDLIQYFSFIQFEKLNNILKVSNFLFANNVEIYDFTYFSKKNQIKHLNSKNQKKLLLEILNNNKNDFVQRKPFEEFDFIQDYLSNDEINKVFYILDLIINDDTKPHMWDKLCIIEDYEFEFIFLKDLHRVLNNYIVELNRNKYNSEQSLGAFKPRHYNVKILFDYIINNYDNILKELYNNDQLVKFQSTINKYITSKEITFDRKLNFIITDKHTKTELPFEKLSSGEKKIINLFEVIYFGVNETGNNKFLLLDEPELSLSIYWQEMILDDLLESSYNKVIICTQSPNLLTKDSLKYLIEVKK